MRLGVIWVIEADSDDRHAMAVIHAPGKAPAQKTVDSEELGRVPLSALRVAATSNRACQK